MKLNGIKFKYSHKIYINDVERKNKYIINIYNNE